MGVQAANSVRRPRLLHPCHELPEGTIHIAGTNSHERPCLPRHPHMRGGPLPNSCANRKLEPRVLQLLQGAVPAVDEQGVVRAVRRRHIPQRHAVFRRRRGGVHSVRLRSLPGRHGPAAVHRVRLGQVPQRGGRVAGRGEGVQLVRFGSVPGPGRADVVRQVRGWQVPRGGRAGVQRRAGCLRVVPDGPVPGAAGEDVVHQVQRGQAPDAREREQCRGAGLRGLHGQHVSAGLGQHELHRLRGRQAPHERRGQL